MIRIIKIDLTNNLNTTKQWIIILTNNNNFMIIQIINLINQIPSKVKMLFKNKGKLTRTKKVIYKWQQIISYMIEANFKEILLVNSLNLMNSIV